MMLAKLIAMGTTSLLGLALGAALPPQDGPPPPPEPKKKKGPEGPGGELTKAYNLLRHLRADGRPAGRPEERLKDWTERSAKLYREAVAAEGRGERRRAHELGVAAHDLARAVDHARNAAIAGTDDDLPPPPAREAEADRTLRDLDHAHERVVELRDDDGPDAKFYFEAAKDLYNAARRDAEAGRSERAGELARAAEALTHVPEHLARAEGDGPEPDEKPEPKHKKDKKEKKEKKEKREKGEPDEKPEPKGKRDRDREPAPPIPPPID